MHKTGPDSIYIDESFSINTSYIIKTHYERFQIADMKISPLRKSQHGVLFRDVFIKNKCS